LKKYRTNKDFDIYTEKTFSDKYKRRILGDETFELLEDIWLSVAFKTQEMCTSKLGYTISIQTIHRHPQCEDLFNRLFERAAIAREAFDPSRKVPMKLYIDATLRFADQSLENWEAKVLPSPHARRRLYKVRDAHPMNKKAQREAWIADGGNGLDFDILDAAKWDRVHTLPFSDEFDGGEISWDVKSEDEGPEEIVVRKSQVGSVQAFMQKLEDEGRDIDRQIMLYHFNKMPAKEIVGKLDLAMTPRSVSRTIKRLLEQAQKYCNPTLFDTGDE
jgi:hypothetical protein